MVHYYLLLTTYYLAPPRKVLTCATFGSCSFVPISGSKNTRRYVYIRGEKCRRIWRLRVCREWRLRRTHEPCVPTGQVDFPHGSLLPTTYYLLLSPPPQGISVHLCPLVATIIRAQRLWCKDYLWTSAI